ncbi:MAG: hypothetical protein EXR02_02590, partial [Rhodospirillales bacterium]|nr:hypothetical protein [Rhodospirillales bacterium]
MGEWTTLRAADGHEFRAWRAGLTPRALNNDTPLSGSGVRAEPLAGLVVVQEIFGVNAHIREVADRFAGMGFAVMAPALFDRAEPEVDLGYEAADAARGREIRGK